MDDVFIYIISMVSPFGRDEGPCKIGISRDVEGRRKELQTGCPNDLRIVRTFRLPSREIAEQAEDCFKFVHDEKRIRGEWFAFSPDQAVAALEFHLILAVNLFTSLSEDKKAIALRLIGIDSPEALS